MFCDVRLGSLGILNILYAMRVHVVHIYAGLLRSPVSNEFRKQQNRCIEGKMLRHHMIFVMSTKG